MCIVPFKYLSVFPVSFFIEICFSCVYDALKGVLLGVSSVIFVDEVLLRWSTSLWTPLVVLFFIDPNTCAYFSPHNEKMIYRTRKTSEENGLKSMSPKESKFKVVIVSVGSLVRVVCLRDGKNGPKYGKMQFIFILLLYHFFLPYFDG